MWFASLVVPISTKMMWRKVTIGSSEQTTQCLVRPLDTLSLSLWHPLLLFFTQVRMTNILLLRGCVTKECHAVVTCMCLVGVPAFYLYHLYSNRHSIKTRNEVCRTAAEEKIRLLHLRPLRILFDVYKPKYWYWEVIETFYRLCLTGVLVLINQGSSLQIIMGVLFSLFFIRLYELACPYEDNTLQQIKDISLVSNATLRVPCIE
jgi:hypothetical protein